MKLKKISVLLSLCGILLARENPFVPAGDIINEAPPKEKIEYFKEVKFKLPDSARILKAIKVSYQNLDGSIDEKIISIEKKFDWHNRFTLTQAEAKEVVEAKKIEKPVIKKLEFGGFIKFEVSKEFVKVITKDTKIRDFMVSKPYKVVLDFKRDANFLTKTFKLKTPPFVSIVLGNHQGYYRVVIELDGHYIYTLKRDGDIYKIVLK